MKRPFLLTLLLTASAGAANLDVATDLELMRGHLYVSVTSYNAGSLQWGRKHAGHSIEELWASLKPSVNATQRATFEIQLNAILAGPGKSPPPSTKRWSAPS